MTIWLRQSTAGQEIPLGYFLDSTDGNTAEDSLTISNTDIKIWKTGATTLSNKNSGGATHIDGGVYYAVLNATDTDTLGPLVIFVHESGSLAVRLECLVLPTNVYDSLVLGSDYLDIETAAMAAGVITASAIATAAIDADAIATNAIGATEIAAGAIAADAFAAGAIDDAAIAADVYAQINAELVDVFDTDILSEPSQGAPPATPTRDQILKYLFYVLRNKGDSIEGIKRFYANDGSTVLWSKATSDDDITYEEDKGISG